MEQICKKERRRKSFSSCRGSHLLSFFSRSASAAHLNSLCSSSSLGICEAIRAEKERCHQDDHLPTTLRRPLDSSNWITVAQLYTKTLESFPKFPIRSCWQPNIYFFHSSSMRMILDSLTQKIANTRLEDQLICQPGWQTHVSTSIWHSVDRKEMATAGGFRRRTYFC